MRQQYNKINVKTFYQNKKFDFFQERNLSLREDKYNIKFRQHDDKRKSCSIAQLEDPREIRHRAGYITLGMTIIVKKGAEKMDESFEFKMRNNLNSLLSHSSGTPLHFVIITDRNSLSSAAESLGSILGQHVAERVITTRWSRARAVPRVTWTFVDCEIIVSRERDFFTAMKRASRQGLGGGGSYSEDLFYIAPIYHKAFASLDRIIFLDSKDLEFRSDIKLLQDQFAEMSEDAVISIGPDLTPHYRNEVRRYRALHPDTGVGGPGPGSQGYNSGVVLYRLDKMRVSAVYTEYIKPQGVDRLMTRYMYKMFLAEQDWLTNLGWTHPELFHNLPCVFNRQTSIRNLEIK